MDEKCKNIILLQCEPSAVFSSIWYADYDNLTITDIICLENNGFHTFLRGGDYLTMPYYEIEMIIESWR